MQSNSIEQQERIDREDSTSPSAGWRAVYAAMGVSSSGDAEQEETTRIRKPTEKADRVPKLSEQVSSASADS